MRALVMKSPQLPGRFDDRSILRPGPRERSDEIEVGTGPFAQAGTVSGQCRVVPILKSQTHYSPPVAKENTEAAVVSCPDVGCAAPQLQSRRSARAPMGAPRGGAWQCWALLIIITGAIADPVASKKQIAQPDYTLYHTACVWGRGSLLAGGGVFMASVKAMNEPMALAKLSKSRVCVSITQEDIV